MEWKVWVSSAESCNEMVFERSYGPFSGIATVSAWGNKLKFGVLLVEVVFKGLAAFIVKGV